MSVTASSKPKRVESVIINDDAEAPSLLNPMTGEIFVTNAVGKHIMELADGEKDVAQIVATLNDRFKGAPEDTIRKDALAFLEDGEKRGLISWQS